MNPEIEFHMDPRLKAAQNNRLALALFAGLADHSLPVQQSRYRPKIGSVAHRVIEHLKTHREGTQLSKKTLCDALNINIKSIDSAMWRAEDAGLVVRSLREEQYTSVSVWSLPIKAKRRAAAPLVLEREEVAA